MTARRFAALSVGLLFFAGALWSQDVPATPASATEPVSTLHPALFLVGDSIMKTGTNGGATGPWGMGYEIIPLFDPAKIHVYNEGAGGRSSRSYGDEGLWAKIVARLQPGDFIIMMFGHNDAANSTNYPERTTITGNGEETLQVGVGNQKKTIHTYGWYLRQYVAEAKAKGVTVILCSQIPRNTWSGGHIKRGFDGYAQWAREAAQGQRRTLYRSQQNRGGPLRRDGTGKDRDLFQRCPAHQESRGPCERGMCGGGSAAAEGLSAEERFIAGIRALIEGLGRKGSFFAPAEINGAPTGS